MGGLEFHRFISAGEFVSRAAMYFFGRECRGHLFEGSQRFGGQAFDEFAIEKGSSIRPLGFTLGIVGVGGESETVAGGVALAAASVETDQTCSFAEKKYEHTSGERIQGAEVTYLAETGKVPDGVHDIVRGLALRLVDDERAVEGSGLWLAGHGQVFSYQF